MKHTKPAPIVIASRALPSRIAYFVCTALLHAALLSFTIDRAAAQDAAVQKPAGQPSTQADTEADSAGGAKGSTSTKEKLPSQITIGSTALRKIGSGVRTARFIGVKVYEAALYAAAPQGQALDWQQLQALPKPQQLRLHFVRAVERKEIEEDLDEGLQAVSDKPESYASQLEQLKKLLGDMKAGSLVEFTATDKGLSVAIDGSQKGDVADPAFAREIFATWLSPNAPFPKLQQSLLGK